MNLYKIMQGPLRGISSGSPPQGPVQERTSPGSPQDLLIVRTCKIMQGPIFKDFSRIFKRASHKDLQKIMQGLLRGFDEDLHKTLSQGPLQDLGQDSHT